jgi:ribonuclease J
MDTLYTKIRFWKGLRTIGGTIVSLEYENDRLLFDFGLNYNPAENFSAIVRTRHNSLVEDYINLGIIPAIDGIYSRKALRNLTDVIAAEEDERNTAVVISHLHLDHIGAMGMVAENIPVILTEDSLKLYEALEEVGEGVLPRRAYSACTYNEDINIGNIKVTPVQVDHDIIGACGFIIETPDLKLVYSGDLRLHGEHKEYTMEFLAKANSFEPDILIMEGTMIEGEKKSRTVKPSFELTGINTEAQVRAVIKNKLKNSSGLLIMNFSERNLERLIGLLEAAEESGRKFVLEPESAYLLSKLSDKRNFLIYKSAELTLKLGESEVPEWLSEMLDKYETITYNEINMRPQDYVLQNSFRNLMELLDLNLTKAVYIHSNAVPLGAYDPDYVKLQEFLKKLKVNYEYIGTSGHAIHSNLKYMIDKIQPKILIPLHSNYPEKLYPESKLQFLPEYGAQYKIRDNKIIKLTVK